VKNITPNALDERKYGQKDLLSMFYVLL